MGHSTKGVPSPVQLKREEQMKVPPEEMFRKETDKYSQFDEQASCCGASSGHLTACLLRPWTFIPAILDFSLKSNLLFLLLHVIGCVYVYLSVTALAPPPHRVSPPMMLRGRPSVRSRGRS